MTTTTKYRIVTISGRGLPTNVDAAGYDTREAAENMACDEHDGDFTVQAYTPRKPPPALDERCAQQALMVPPLFRPAAERPRGLGRWRHYP